MREKLITVGYDYNDMKFDNFGYKFVDYHNDYTFDFDNKIIELKFLDYTSGL